MIKVHKKEDGLWIEFTGIGGKSAMLNVASLAEKYGPVTGLAIILACAEAALSAQGAVVESERGAWQRIFTGKLISMGIKGEQAMAIMGLVCEEREHAYVQGDSNGYNGGYAACKAKLSSAGDVGANLCETCMGAKTIDGKPCSDCGGTGKRISSRPDAGEAVVDMEKCPDAAWGDGLVVCKRNGPCEHKDARCSGHTLLPKPAAPVVDKVMVNVVEGCHNCGWTAENCPPWAGEAMVYEHKVMVTDKPMGCNSWKPAADGKGDVDHEIR